MAVLAVPSLGRLRSLNGTLVRERRLRGQRPTAAGHIQTWLRYSSRMLREHSERSDGIRLPRFIGARNLDGLFGVCEDIRLTDGEIVLDGQDVAFIDPLGIAVLGATLEPRRDTRPCSMPWLSPEVGTYIDRMNVLRRCGITDVDSRCVVRHDRRNALVELKCIEHEHEVDEAADALATAIAGTLTDNAPDAPKDEVTGRNDFDNFRHPLSYVLRELLSNSLSHARKEGHVTARVWVAAQYFEPKGLVQMAVVDNGCGILSTLRNSPELQKRTHLAAIEAALQPFVTCNPDIGLPGGTSNQGVGLTTSARVAQAARGGITVVSGDGVVQTMERRSQSFTLRDGSFWPGTAILFQCRRGDLPAVNIPALLPPIDELPGIALRFAP